jgi:hypothetical protein
MKKMFAISVFFFCLMVKADYLNFATTMDGTSSHVKGPNCWNGALVAVGVLRSKRFIRPEEWTGHLSNNCIELEGPKEGAVGRIFHVKDNLETEIHGFIHLDETTIFAKHGERTEHGYMIMSYEEMLAQYGKDRSCRVNNDDSPECFHQIKYYQCDREASFHPRLKDVASLLDELIFSQETSWFHKVTCEDGNFLKRQELLNRITSELEGLFQELSNHSNHGDSLRLFLNNKIHESVLESFSHQIYNVEVSLRSFRCEDRKKRNQSVKAAKRAAKALRQLFK